MNAVCLSIFSTGNIAVFSRHEATWMNHIEYDESNKHWKGIDAVLIRFMVWDIALQPL
jgi:hypothetical protein